LKSTERMNTQKVVLLDVFAAYVVLALIRCYETIKTTMSAFPFSLNKIGVGAWRERKTKKGRRGS